MGDQQSTICENNSCASIFTNNVHEPPFNSVVAILLNLHFVAGPDHYEVEMEKMEL